MLSRMEVVIMEQKGERLSSNTQSKTKSARVFSLRSLICLILIGITALAITTPALATSVESGGGAILGYLDYSYDKNTVIFNTTSKYAEAGTVFFDTFYPFDTSLRYLYADPVVRYQLDNKPHKLKGFMMVALSDLQKIYAPYFSYSVNNNEITVTHHYFNKHVIAGQGTRSPTVEYTKIVWEGVFSLKSNTGSVKKSTYRTTTNSSQIDTQPVIATSGPDTVTLDCVPLVYGHLVYVPVASFMQALGKTITDSGAKKGYLAISSIGPDDTSDDLFNPVYGAPCTPITDSRVAYMDGVLNGTITKGNFWNAFYMGDVTVFTGSYDAAGNDITAVQSVNRILPYRVYVPKNYDPNLPSKFTFLLHGGTGNENAPIERPNDHFNNQPSPLPGIVHDTVENYSDVYNYIVLSPNGWTRGPMWGKGPGEVSLLTAYTLINLTYNIDPSKQFIMGNSQGGGGTLNFAVRHPEMFKAMSAQAVVSGPNKSVLAASDAVNLPLLFIQGTTDVTNSYKTGVTYYNNTIKGVVKDATFMAVEQGHHSYGWSSPYAAIYQFFDRQLEPSSPVLDVNEVFFTVDSTTAQVTNSSNQVQNVLLTTAPILSGDTKMVALADLASIYGPTFNYNKVYAYNNDPAALASAVTTTYSNISVNIALPGVTGNVLTPTFLRVDATFKEGDSYTGTPPVIDPRTLSVPASIDASGHIFVPVVEFMALFGKTVH
jgi:hypothetical protein